MAGGFVEDDRGRCGGVEGLNPADHGNADARIGAALDFFRQTCALVANEEGYRLAPVDFPRSEQRLFAVARFVDARCQRANAGDLELCEKNRERHPN